MQLATIKEAANFLIVGVACHVEEKTTPLGGSTVRSLYREQKFVILLTSVLEGYTSKTQSLSL